MKVTRSEGGGYEDISYLDEDDDDHQSTSTSWLNDRGMISRITVWRASAPRRYRPAKVRFGGPPNTRVMVDQRQLYNSLYVGDIVRVKLFDGQVGDTSGIVVGCKSGRIEVLTNSFGRPALIRKFPVDWIVELNGIEVTDVQAVMAT